MTETAPDPKRMKTKIVRKKVIEREN